MNDEYFNNVKKQMKLFEETDKLNSNINITDASTTINNIFQSFNIQDRISSNDIEFSNSFLWNKPYIVWDKKLDSNIILRKLKLSEIIFDHYYPKPTETTFYHFTTYANFISIIKNQELWLFNLAKRFQEGEFRLFYIDHGITGYQTNRDYNGEIMEKSLMKQTFYTSFAKSSTIRLEDEESLWNSFGEGGLGVRLEFEINPKYADFRNVFYKQDGVPKTDLLINKITSEVQSKYNRNFTLSGISKIGGFYLQGDFDTENETRLLIKESTDDYKFNFTKHNYGEQGDIKFIKLKLFDNSFADFKIKSIQPGNYINDNRIEKLLEQYPLPEKPKIMEKADF
ncbi:hypothetical protein ACHRV5_01705 [Flavobacterium sp. FlaQc-52]|jgi:hypothetical protein|uniref:hypothetical protein n=1 Tax=Flavobacterium sp. FlaQc-52 TaxID=3374185 RepID=UPI0037573065